ncbi:MAG: glycosyltransferase family 4 protein [Acidimicrobiales bacterium]
MSATRTKRVLSVHPVAERGGSDYCLLGMVRILADDGWECHIALPTRSPLQEDFLAAGAILHVVPMRRITTSGSAWYWAGYAALWPVSVIRLLVLARRVRADVVHSNSLHSWYGWAVAALLRKPHLWSAREIVVQSRAALRLERWLCRHFATVVLAASTAVARQLRGARVVVVHDVPDAERFRPGNAGRFRPRVGISDTVRLVGAAGRIDTWKGFGIVLDAVPSIREHRRDVEFVVAGGSVAGKEAYADELARRASSLEGVHWLGPRTDMSDLLADLDVFVLASTEPEPFATVLAEALASGVPCVATDHGGSPEMLANVKSEDSVLVRPGDAAALAAGVTALVPPGPSSEDERRSRHALHVSASPTFAEVFDDAVSREAAIHASRR